MCGRAYSQMPPATARISVTASSLARCGMWGKVKDAVFCAWCAYMGHSGRICRATTDDRSSSPAGATIGLALRDGGTRPYRAKHSDFNPVGPLPYIRIVCTTSTSTNKEDVKEMVRSALILALALALPLSICQAQTDQGPLERTGRTIKHGAQATGRTLKHGAQATGQTLEHGAKATGRTVGKGVRKTGRTVEHLEERSSSR